MNRENYESYKEERGLTEEDRVLTYLEQDVLEACHHDHGCMSIPEAAIELAQPGYVIRDALARLKKKAPQMFPIMTRKQKEIYFLITEHGLTHTEVAGQLGLDRRQVTRTITLLRKKGFHFERPPKTVSCGKLQQITRQHD